MGMGRKWMGIDGDRWEWVGIDWNGKQKTSIILIMAIYSAETHKFDFPPKRTKCLYKNYSVQKQQFAKIISCRKGVIL